MRSSLVAAVRQMRKLRMAGTAFRADQGTANGALLAAGVSGTVRTIRPSSYGSMDLSAAGASACHRGVGGPPRIAQPSSLSGQLPELSLWNESLGRGLGRIGALQSTESFA